MTEREKAIIKDNLHAYLTHFQPITIEKYSGDKGYYVYQNGDSTNTSYIQYCSDIHYLNGWLYGAVQAHCKIIKVKEETSMYTLEELNGMETIREGQFDDLKVETENTKVWLSRMTVADGMPYDNMVTEYIKVGCEWEKVREYQAL